ncbi:MAG: hypothetical protein QOE31_1020 [Solirubrobacteraceae bacterium]|nr:hypothetical protein [Solirubrobacteraceae bacterium]
MLLPARVTPHTLRRTFASLCFFAGRDLRWVMGQLGHDDPRMTLAVYAQCMKRSQIDEAVVWQLMRFRDEAEKQGREPTLVPRMVLYEEFETISWGLNAAWARRVSNLRPLACEASALPLSYAPYRVADCTRRSATGAAGPATRGLAGCAQGHGQDDPGRATEGRRARQPR